MCTSVVRRRVPHGAVGGRARHDLCLAAREQRADMEPVLPNAPRLTDLRIVRPLYESSQEDTLAWLARAHTEAERAHSSAPDDLDGERFAADMERLLRRFGCSPESIARRGYEIPDVGRTGWADMLVYDFALGPEGAPTQARMRHFARVTERVLEGLYAGATEPPRDLLHVTCTGYTSPSAAQRLVARRGWGSTTRVLHAYHMGCYAALPAVRIATALALGGSPRADIVHTEICSLHLRPLQHAPEQLVVQSLFADGHARYSVVPAARCTGPAFAILGAREELLANSADAMTWTASDAGMDMTLARDLPRRVASAVRDFVAELRAEVMSDRSAIGRDVVFAVHPGGPRVIDAVQGALELSDAQVAASRDVLRRYGNMSSATLPHIWNELLASDDVPDGTPIVSLAFGPGLTMAGSIMVKVS
jgi:predicted naringenin-chalcone synthase